MKVTTHDHAFDHGLPGPFIFQILSCSKIGDFHNMAQNEERKCASLVVEGVT